MHSSSLLFPKPEEGPSGSSSFSFPQRVVEIPTGIVPTDWDVCIGLGRLRNKGHGNRKFYDLMLQHSTSRASHFQREHSWQAHLVKAWNDMGGRFLTRDQHGNICQASESLVLRWIDWMQRRGTKRSTSIKRNKKKVSCHFIRCDSHGVSLPNLLTHLILVSRRHREKVRQS